MSVINTNYLSLVAQNNLSKSQSALGTAIERLSSGLRINSAKDDAAGQSIANRMSAQVQGLNQAARNANDGISAAQTTEGALNQINDNLNRIRVLTVQAENGTNNEDDLNSIQNEIGQRLQEINRISEETEFNGKKVLANGESLSIQVGANDNQKITIDMVKINTEELGIGSFNVNGKGVVDNRAATVDDLKLADNVQVGGTVQDPTYTFQVKNTAATAADVLGTLEDTDTVTLTATDAGAAITSATKFGFGAAATMSGTFTSDGEGNLSFDVNAFAKAAAAAYITGGAEGPVLATYTNTTGSQEIAVDSTGKITDRDGNALFIDTTSGQLSLNNAGGVAATATNLTDYMSGAGVAAGDAKLSIEGGPTLESDAAAGTLAVKDATVTNAEFATIAKDNAQFITTTVQTTSDTPVNITIKGDGSVVESGSTVGVYVNADNELVDVATTDTELFVRDNDKITDASANQYFVDEEGNLTTDAQTVGGRTQDALSVLDAAIAKVDGFRSDLGAIQNRFESAIENLTTTSTNLAAAQSRIQDADYAVEVANMTRAQILQQAGTSVLAQANQIPQGVLSLLR